MKPTLLDELFVSFQTGIRAKKSEVPRKYLEELGLDYMELNIGFISGQFHHRKDEAFRKPYIDIGVLRRSNQPVREKDMIAYTCFGAYGVVFPLKDEQGHIVNLYATRIKKASKPSEYLNDKGLYPGYPHEMTQRLYVTYNIYDTASLLQSKVLESRDAVIALHDGKLLPQHHEAINRLTHLEQIILINR